MSQSNVMVVGTAQFCAALGEHVRAATGLSVVGVTTTAAARAILQLGAADTVLAIVQAGLSDGEAFAFCADVARTSGSPPIMMIGDEGSEAEAIRCLQAGAIDYFPRPHNQAELLARIRAHLRSLATFLEVEISIGPFVFRPGQRTLTDRTTRARIRLTAKETKLLRCLNLANGQPVPVASLIEVAWSSANTSVHTLHTHMYRLRSKLGAKGGGRPMLQTARTGYALVN